MSDESSPLAGLRLDTSDRPAWRRPDRPLASVGMSTEHVRWLTDPRSERPLLIAAFTGWNDAGDAASSAMRTMIESWGAEALAEIDPEPFTDFATVRPQIRLDDDNRRAIIWPTVGVWQASLPGTDVVLVLGPEPALRWRSFCEQLQGIAERTGASMAITMGALLADVPHSRAVPLIGTASDEVLMDRFELERSTYEGPTGIVGVLHDTFQGGDIPTASLWAAVPGYASQVPSPKAAIALLERTCSMLGTPAPLQGLAADAADYDDRVTALIGGDDDMLDYLRRIEAMADEQEASVDDLTNATPVDGDELLAEVEQFLRESNDDN